MKNLFKFENVTNAKMRSGAPRLAPSGGGGIVESLSRNFLKMDAVSSNVDGLIDVINEFHWTSSQLSSRQDMPSIMLKEKRLKQNSLVAQLAYYGMIASEEGGAVTGRLSNLFSNSKLSSGPFGQLIGGIAGKFISGFGQKISGALSNFGSGIGASGIIQALTGKSPASLLSGLIGESSSSDVLSPYEGLYITEPTKFTYRMPYFEDAAAVVANAFGSEDKALTNNMGLGKLAAGGAALAETIANTMASSMYMSEPGMYIEKPQFYSFAASGDSISFSFPLLNTGWATFEDVQRNWQLIYMLVYQNRPNRKTRILIDPPCLYEVMIPGVKYMPYAFVKSLNVQFVGSRRSYVINIPNSGGGSTKIQTIIPDAYMVTMTLQGLLGETQNFLYHMLYEKQNKVNVIESISNIIGENFIDGYQRESSNAELNAMNQKVNKRTQN